MPIALQNWRRNTLLLCVVVLLNTAFTMLRNIRSTLAVADVGGTAALIPYYELLGTVPAAIALSWLLARFLRRWSVPKLFALTLCAFCFFFFLYVAFLYPFWRQQIFEEKPAWWGGVFFLHMPIMLFFAVAELWKVALFSILLWGYVNQQMPLANAKVLYAPMMLGTSLGAILAQPLTKVCSASPLFIPWTVDHWHASFCTQMLAIAALSGVILLLFWTLIREFKSSYGEENVLLARKAEASAPQLGLKSSILHTLRSPYLRALGMIVIADYIVYSLVEVVFLDKLKLRYPNPEDYCSAMAQLALWGGALTAVTALLIGPQLLKHLPWVFTALATPFLALPVVAGFLAITLAENNGWLPPAQALDYYMICGGVFYCLGRATKYALLDSAKELAYIPLPQGEQMQGKLVIESLASRGGRGIASLTSIFLFSTAGSVAASAPAALILALAGTCVWIVSTITVGSHMEALTEDAIKEGESILQTT